VITFYPAKQFVTPADKLNRALRSIREELEARIVDLEAQGKLLEAQRLKMRTEYDLEMLQEMGSATGLKIIRVIYRAGHLAQSPIRSSISSRKTFSWLSMNRTPPSRRSVDVRRRPVSQDGAG